MEIKRGIDAQSVSLPDQTNAEPEANQQAKSVSRGIGDVASSYESAAQQSNLLKDQAYISADAPLQAKRDDLGMQIRLASQGLIRKPELQLSPGNIYKTAMNDLAAITGKSVQEVERAFQKDSVDLTKDFSISGEAASAVREELSEVKEAIKTKLDSLSEMGEMESLRLQMSMDRLSKLMSTLSNLLKKAASTSDEITQHIK